MKAFQFCDKPVQTKSRVMNTYAVRGLAVQVDLEDATQWTAAEDDNPTQVYFLEREVVTGSVTQALKDAYLPDIGPQPEIAGQQCAGRRTFDIEVEGEDNLVLSGDDSLASADAGDKISFAAGKICALPDGSTARGVISEVLTPKISDNSVRFRIEIY